MTGHLRKFSYSLFWNSGLIVAGSLIQVIILKGIGAEHQFVPGGLFGIATIIYYLTGKLDPGMIYLLLNIPMFILGYLYVSRRFLWYSALAMLVVSLSYPFIHVQINIADQFYAAVVFGAVLGIGAGIVLRSLGSNGGADVLAIILNQKFNLGIGKFFFAFNLILYLISLLSHSFK